MACGKTFLDQTLSDLDGWVFTQSTLCILAGVNCLAYRTPQLKITAELIHRPKLFFFEAMKSKM